MPIRPTPRSASSPATGLELPTYTRSLAEGTNPRALLHTEWLLTSGLGGFSMGTALGAPTRRYHGLLVTAAPGSARRMMTLSAVAEQVVVNAPGQADRIFDLSTFLFAGDDPRGVLHPGGCAHLLRFEKEAGVCCRWVYRLEGTGLDVVRTVAPHHGARAVSIGYTLASTRPGARVRLLLRPLVAMRDFHHLRRHPSGAHEFRITPGAMRGAQAVTTVGSGGLSLDVGVSAGTFGADGLWWNNLFYPLELERGQDHVEDLYSPGLFTCDLREGKPVTVQASVDGTALVHAEDAAAARRERTRSIVGKTLARIATAGKRSARADDAAVAALVCAGDDFVVAVPDPAAGSGTKEVGGGGGGGAVSIIAGYPWFADWGRDTMISLPGLLLVTGRHEEAFGALVRFARARRRGIIPNRFDDATGEPHYNTADASLWFIHAACAYMGASGDREGFVRDLLPACLDVVEHYRRGTDYSIAMDPDDYLITAGTPATQLTWMDAHRDGVTFTPRHGKPVEINALWITGLAGLAGAMGSVEQMRAADLRSLSEAAGRSFRKYFWLDEHGCCADLLAPPGGTGDSWTPVAQVRPNQLFAVSLPNSPLSPAQQRSVVRVVRERLLTPRAVRTLDPADPAYRGRYRGTLFERDGTYHNGTAWPWLMGPLAEAMMRAEGFSPASRAQARALLRPLIEFLDGTCPGQLPEVFDGDDTPEAPQSPGGCPAQAWSVAEVLRVWVMVVAAGGKA